MQKIINITELKNAIEKLERQQNDEWPSLRVKCICFYEKIRAEQIQSMNEEINEEPDLKDELVNTTLGLIAGYVSRKLVIGKSENPVRHLIGTAVQIGVTGIVSRNTPKIKSTVAHLADRIFEKKNQSHPDHEENSDDYTV